jgi:NADH dehydrogenase (ubiquinone) 1 alpha subcomplex subunit 9
MLHLIELVTYNSPTRAPTIPKRIALFAARAAQLVWWPLLSPDEVIRRYIDDVGAGKDGEVNVEPVWDLLGVQPEELEDVAISYLRRYRSASVPLSPSGRPFILTLVFRANFAKPVYGRTPVHSQ